MKKAAIILFAALMVVGMAACAENSPLPASNPPTTTPASPSPSVAETVTATTEPPVESASATATAAGGGKDYGQIGTELMKSETIGSLKLGMTESEVLAAIGTAESETEPEVWGADGKKHTNWYYPGKGLTVSMVESDNPQSEQVVYAIAAEAPCDFATANGIKIGSTKEEVLAAYGSFVEDQSDETTADSIIAGTLFGGLIFGMENGAVNSIFLGAAAE